MKPIQDNLKTQDSLKKRKVWDIHGGIHPPENKTQSNQTPISKVPLPEQLIVPLNQHIGSEALPIVEVGQHVLKGEKIADAQGPFSASVHAPSSGTVCAIEGRPVPHPSGMNSTCIVVDTDGKESWTKLTPCKNYRECERDKILEHLRESGIAGMGGAGFPTAIKLHPTSNKKIDTLILNGTECEPYITADDRLMRERADEIVAGALLFHFLLHEPEDILIGIEDNKPEAIAAMQAAAQGTAVEVVVFPTKYPSGGEKQLIQILTGKEVPSQGLPADMGIVVQNVATAAAAFRAVRYGEPSISRITTLVGEALEKKGNVELLIGTPLTHVLEHFAYQATENNKQLQRVVIGGPMMGYTIEDLSLPIIKTTNCVLVASEHELAEPAPAQPCIRCGMCAEACPAQLLPQQLFWYAQAQDNDRLHALNLFDCIECGACAYVCPSNIPLVQYYRASKGSIRQQEEEKQKADRSRERFEVRKLRLEKAEKEKALKREARRKAAEEAKKQVANQNKSEPSKSATTVVDNREKLERALLAAENKLKHAQQELEDAETSQITEQRLDSLKAKLKAAEHKYQRAKKNLNKPVEKSNTVETE